METASGYEIAWKDTSTGDYTVWTTDAHGNYLGNAITAVVGQQLCAGVYPKTIFHQDLNGDGAIGVHALLIQTDTDSHRLDQPGATPLGGNYFLFDAGTTIRSCSMAGRR